MTSHKSYGTDYIIISEIKIGPLKSFKDYIRILDCSLRKSMIMIPGIADNEVILV